MHLIFLFLKKHLWWSHRSNHKLISKLMKLSVGLSIFVGGLKTKKSLRPGWLCTNQAKKGEKKDYISQKDYFSNTCGTPNNIYLYQSTWHNTPKDSNLVVLVTGDQLWAYETRFKILLFIQMTFCFSGHVMGKYRNVWMYRKSMPNITKFSQFCHNFAM